MSHCSSFRGCLHNDIKLALASDEHKEGEGGLHDEHIGHVELTEDV